MGKENSLVTQLTEALTKAQELEETNKKLAEELGKANVENWQLKQEIEKLKAEVGRWKSVAFKANPK